MHQYWYDLRVNKLEHLLPSWLIDNDYTLSHPDTDTKPIQSLFSKIRLININQGTVSASS